MNLKKFVKNGMAAQAAVDALLPHFDPQAGPPPLPEKKQRQKILLNHCRVEWRGDFYLIIGPDEKGCGNRVLWREHRDLCYVSVAYSRLQPVSAKWKTFDLLVTLRQAIRECYVQGMPLELPLIGAGKAKVMQFIRDARAYDRVHHGVATF